MNWEKLYLRSFYSITRFKIMKNKNIIKLVISALLIVYIIYYIANNTDEFLKLKHITFLQIVQMYLVYCIFLMVVGQRMLIIAREYGLRNISFVGWIRIFLLARFFNKFIPQAGNIYRAVKLKNDHGFSYQQYLTTLLSFIWMDTITMLMILTIVFLLFERSFIILGMPVYALSLILLVGLSVSPLIISYFSKYKTNIDSRFSKIFRYISDSINILYLPGLIIKQLFLSTVSFSLYVYILNICAIGIGVEVPLFMLVIFAAVIKLSSYVVITPGNIGIKELALGYLSMASNLDFGDGIMIAGITRIIIYISTISMGCLFGGIPMIKDLQAYKLNNKEDIHFEQGS